MCWNLKVKSGVNVFCCFLSLWKQLSTKKREKKTRKHTNNTFLFVVILFFVCLFCFSCFCFLFFSKQQKQKSIIFVFLRIFSVLFVSLIYLFFVFPNKYLDLNKKQKGLIPPPNLTNLHVIVRILQFWTCDNSG